jgi:cytochrome c oxidase subunit 2
VPENWAEGVWTRACPHPETDRFVRRCLGVVAKFAFFQPHVYFSHWAMLEFLWTLVPCVILVFIAVPSFALVLALDQGFKPVLWIKVMGNQWFWTYECSTYSSTPSLVSFESVMTPDSELKDNYLRLLSVDNILTIPCLKPVRFLVTSNDVIHSWTVPSMGLKIDAVPGRINMANLLCMRPGIYYGQCSEICGVNHAFMPIAVSVILPRK